MKSFSTIASVLIFFHSCSFLDAKSSLQPGNSGKPGLSQILPLKKYDEFQISDGKAGNSLARANKVFVEPFKNADLQKITKSDLKNLATMSRAAVQNEQLFNAAIKKAAGTDKSLVEPLAAGKIANKVLKLVSEIQTIEMRQKFGIKQHDPENKLKELRTKLAKNDRVDRSNAGKKMISYLSVGKREGEDKEKDNETATREPGSKEHDSEDDDSKGGDNEHDNNKQDDDKQQNTGGEDGDGEIGN